MSSAARINFEARLEALGRAHMIRVTVALAGLLLITCLPTSSARAEEFLGSPGKIIDGDLFWLCDANICNKLRLCGVKCSGDV